MKPQHRPVFLIWIAIVIVVVSVHRPARAQEAPPPVTIVEPLPEAVVNDLRRAHGTFERGVGRASLVRIEVLWKRAVDSALWNGTSWGRAQTWLPAQLSFSSRRWSFSRGPGRDALSEGFYYLYARAVPSRTDVFFMATSRVRVDLTGPTAQIEAPASNRMSEASQVLAATAYARASGTAYDKSGVASVQVALRREGDGRFWNGAEWVEGVQLLPASLSVLVGEMTRRWQWDNGPDASQIQPGVYTLLCVAGDAVGNRSTVFVTTRVADAPQF